MSDTSINQFLSQADDSAARTGFVPVPPSPASDLPNGYLCFQRDTDALYAWNSDTSAWVLISSGAGTLPATVQGDMLYASAADTIAALAKNASATRYLSNTGSSNNPAWAQVNLADGVTGDLPFANLTQGSALSVLGVTGNSTADNASIAAGSDHQVLRRSGTAVAFGQVNLAQSAAVTGVLPVANGGTGSASGAAILKASFALTDAQIKALPTTALNVIAAPGAGFRIHPLSGYLMIDTTTADYTNIHADSRFKFQIATLDMFSYCLNGNATGLAQVTEMMTSSTEAIFRLTPYADGSGAPGVGFTDGWGLVAATLDANAMENQPLIMSCTNTGGDFTGGNAANTGKVVILYMVEPTL